VKLIKPIYYGKLKTINDILLYSNKVIIVVKILGEFQNYSLNIRQFNYQGFIH